MVQLALNRARRLVPEHQILVVVNEDHRRHWEPELIGFSPRNLLVQPANRGTAAAVMLATLTIQARSDSDVPVIFLASDHLVGDEETLRHGAQDALKAAATTERGVYMLGLEDVPGDRDCGWILAADERRTTFVYRFFEKPPSDTVRHLLDRDALVSAFIFAARARTIVDIVIEAAPALAREFVAHRRMPVGVVDLFHVYDTIDSTDLSKVVFQQGPHHLMVVRVPECGWVDLGSPAHLLDYAARRPSGRAVAAA
jgi:mannose-1-phosphate guanylyltransferase